MWWCSQFAYWDVLGSGWDLRTQRKSEQTQERGEVHTDGNLSFRSDGTGNPGAVRQQLCALMFDIAFWKIISHSAGSVDFGMMKQSHSGHHITHVQVTVLLLAQKTVQERQAVLAAVWDSSVLKGNYIYSSINAESTYKINAMVPLIILSCLINQMAYWVNMHS